MALGGGFVFWNRKQQRAAAAAALAAAATTDPGFTCKGDLSEWDAPAAGGAVLAGATPGGRGPPPPAGHSLATRDLSTQDLERGTAGGYPILSIDSGASSLAQSSRGLGSYPLSSGRGPSLGAAQLEAAALGSAGAPVSPGTSTGGASKASKKSTNKDLAAAIVGLWDVKFGDLQLEGMVGKGSYGKVYAAKWNETQVAVKKLDELEEWMRTEGGAADPNGSRLVEELKAEAGLLASLRHPNIVAFMGMCTDPPCIITEFCAKGSLTDVLRGGRRDPAAAAKLTWARRLHMALEGATGMLNLHSQSPPIIHRDLKSPNLLVDGHWHIKVSDFNLSKWMSNSTMSTLQSGNTMANMNPRWLAPEILRGDKATIASDIFGFGIVLWELLCWDIPWASEPTFRIMALVLMEGAQLEVPPVAQLPGGGFPGLPDYVSLMRRCSAPSAKDRPASFTDVILELRAMLAKEEKP